MKNESVWQLLNNILSGRHELKWKNPPPYSKQKAYEPTEVSLVEYPGKNFLPSIMQLYKIWPMTMTLMRKQ